MNGGNDGIWDEELSHLLNSPVHGELPWLPNGAASAEAPPVTRKDIGRLASFDLNEVNQQPAMTTQDISYERKKSRAKITRVEVNNGFDELLQVLRLPNSRKNSRAKVIQYACERIRALEQENERLKQQMPPVQPANPGTMVWIPCSLAPTPILLPQMRVPQRPSKKARKASTIKPVAAAASSMLHTLVYTCPHLLRFFDASTLARIQQLSSEWRRFIADAKQAYLWESLIQARWRVSSNELARLATGSMRQKWLNLHNTMLVPRGVYSDDSTSEQNKGNSIVAKGRARGIDLWGVLARRSNSRTTRSVWRDGAITVMQVVELRLVVQNLTASPVTVDLSSISVWPFQVLDASYGTLFEPRWIALNGVKCASTDQMHLKHLDFGVISVYVSCPQVEFEEVFLARAQSIHVTCQSKLHAHPAHVVATFLPPLVAPTSYTKDPVAVAGRVLL